MAGEKRKAAICIGVGQAGKRLPYLRGAINGTREFHLWASALGYDAKLVIDDPDPVTLPRLRQELEDLLRSAITAPIHRLVLYFAGHGLIREVEEGLWLLSDWDEELRAVAVEALKRRLYMHGIKQIAIVADACRSLPPDVQASDLTPDPVLGRGPIKPVTTPEIDKFISAQDGSESYMVPGDRTDDDRCIFSGVLLEGLWATKPAAFSKLVPNKITSQSLAAYLKTEVPQVADRYKFTLNPNAIPTFSNGDDIYFGDGPPPTPPTFPQWPPPEKVLARMGRPKEISGGDSDEIEIDTAGGAAPESRGIPLGISSTQSPSARSPSPPLRCSIVFAANPDRVHSIRGPALRCKALLCAAFGRLPTLWRNLTAALTGGASAVEESPRC